MRWRFNSASFVTSWKNGAGWEMRVCETSNLKYMVQRKEVNVAGLWSVGYHNQPEDGLTLVLQGEHSWILEAIIRKGKLEERIEVAVNKEQTMWLLGLKSCNTEEFNRVRRLTPFSLSHVACHMLIWTVMKERLFELFFKPCGSLTQRTWKTVFWNLPLSLLSDTKHLNSNHCPAWVCARPQLGKHRRITVPVLLFFSLFSQEYEVDYTQSDSSLIRHECVCMLYY